MKKLFGTDGIRGLANVYPLTTEVCIKLARAICEKFLMRDNSTISEKKNVLIGKDTRLSGDVFEHAFAAAFSSMGVDVKLLGVIPTPAVSILCKTWEADMGIVISASHNPYYDNGIKLFNSDGLKLTDNEEIALENLMFNENEDHVEFLNAHSDITYEKIGRVIYAAEGIETYVEKITRPFDCFRTKNIKKKIVVDSANGALSEIAPKIFKNCGFDVVSISDAPNGTNINENCGVMHMNVLAEAVLKNKADFGVAFDGDGDRVLLCDEKGRILNGDDILSILSLEESHGEIISTVMCNCGFEQYLHRRNIKLTKTNVGDRYISEYLKNGTASLGGEPSGHIIIKSHAPTGDGLFASLKICEILLRSGKSLGEMRLFDPFPSVSRNVRVKNKSVVEDHTVQKAINNCKMKIDGKLIVRPSGTEPMIRIYAEGKNISELNKIINEIAEVMENADGNSNS